VPLRLFDSFEKRKVELQPLQPGKVSVYVCGPTPYAPAHIGHARSAIAFDVIRRHLAWSGYQVTFVRNVTDIDDKIIKRANERGENPFELARRFSDAYDEDMLACGCLVPDHQPRVTESIPDVIEIVGKLVELGKAYPAGGDVYYSVASFPTYGRLSGQAIDELESGARVEPGEHKQNPLDFALWKAAKPGEPSWDSPWGKGRPGWHIECSAMVRRIFGDDLDLHGGGQDLKFPHHENEVAQSQGVTGPGTFARYWMHNGFVNMSGEKMSKSLGNVLDMADLLRRHDGEGIRFFLAQHHYRAPIDFEVIEKDGQPVFPGLVEAERKLDYFYTTLARIDDFLGGRTDVEAGPVVPEAEKLVTAVREAMDDDFNANVAVAELYEAARAANKLLDDPKGTPKDVRRRSLARLGRDLREAAGGALGLLGRPPREFLHARRTRLAAARAIVPAEVEERLQEREQARRAKDFTRADAIRTELRARGIEVMDTPAGADWRVSDD
jgi:cysteinyl-tRNA synthetase